MYISFLDYFLFLLYSAYSLCVYTYFFCNNINMQYTLWCDPCQKVNTNLQWCHLWYNTPQLVSTQSSLSAWDKCEQFAKKEGRMGKENQFPVTFSEMFNFMMPRPGQDPRNKHVTASLQWLRSKTLWTAYITSILTS